MGDPAPQARATGQVTALATRGTGIREVSGVATNYDYFFCGIHKYIRGIYFQLVLGGEMIMVMRHPDDCSEVRNVIHLLECNRQGLATYTVLVQVLCP